MEQPPLCYSAVHVMEEFGTKLPQFWQLANLSQFSGGNSDKSWKIRRLTQSQVSLPPPRVPPFVTTFTIAPMLGLCIPNFKGPNAILAMPKKTHTSSDLLVFCSSIVLMNIRLYLGKPSLEKNSILRKSFVNPPPLGVLRNFFFLFGNFWKFFLGGSHQGLYIILFIHKEDHLYTKKGPFKS